jgi:hypothetical protein
MFFSPLGVLKKVNKAENECTKVTLRCDRANIVEVDKQ